MSRSKKRSLEEDISENEGSDFNDPNSFSWEPDDINSREHDSEENTSPMKHSDKKRKTSSSTSKSQKTKARRYISDKDIKDTMDEIEQKKSEWINGGHPANVFLTQLAGAYGMDNYAQFLDTTPFDNLFRRVIEQMQSKKDELKTQKKKMFLNSVSAVLKQTSETLDKIEQSIGNNIESISFITSSFVSTLNESAEIVSILIQQNVNSDSTNVTKKVVRVDDQPKTTFGNGDKKRKLDQEWSSVKFFASRYEGSDLNDDAQFLNANSVGSDFLRNNWYTDYLQIHPILFPLSPFTCKLTNTDSLAKSKHRDMHFYLEMAHFLDFSLNYMESNGNERLSMEPSRQPRLIYPCFCRYRLLFALFVRLNSFTTAGLNTMFDNLRQIFYSQVVQDFEVNLTNAIKNNSDKSDTRKLNRTLRRLRDYLNFAKSNVNIQTTSGYYKMPIWIDQAVTFFLEKCGLANDKITEQLKTQIAVEHFVGLILSRASALYIYVTLLKLVIREDLDRLNTVIQHETVTSIVQRTQIDLDVLREDKDIPILIAISPEFGAGSTTTQINTDNSLVFWKYKIRMLEKYLLPYLLNRWFCVISDLGMIRAKQITLSFPFTSNTTSNQIPTSTSSSVTLTETSANKEIDEEQIDDELSESILSPGDIQNTFGGDSNQELIIPFDKHQTFVDELKETFAHANEKDIRYTQNIRAFASVSGVFETYFCRVGEYICNFNGIVDTLRRDVNDDERIIIECNISKQNLLLESSRFLSSFGDVIVGESDTIYSKGSNKRTFTNYINQSATINSRSEPTQSIQLNWYSISKAIKLASGNITPLEIYGPTLLRKLDEIKSLDVDAENGDDMSEYSSDENEDTYLDKIARIKYNIDHAKILDIDQKVPGVGLNRDVQDYIQILFLQLPKQSGKSSDALESNKYRITQQAEVNSFDTLTRCINTLVVIVGNIQNTIFKVLQTLDHKKVLVQRVMGKQSSLHQSKSKLSSEDRQLAKDILELSPKEFWILQATTIKRNTQFFITLESKLPIRMSAKITTECLSSYTKIIEFCNTQSYLADDRDDLDFDTPEGKRKRNILAANVVYKQLTSGVHGIVYSRNGSFLNSFALLVRTDRAQLERSRPNGQVYVQAQAMVWLQVQEHNYLDFLHAYTVAQNGLLSINYITKKGAKKLSTEDEEKILGAFTFVKN